MKLDNVVAFIHNLDLAGSTLSLIGLSGAPMGELESLSNLWIEGDFETYTFPEDFPLLSQMSLFSRVPTLVLAHVEKLKKDHSAMLVDYIRSQSSRIFLLSTSSLGLEPLYAQFKNELLWLDLSKEKPWEKKDRGSLILQSQMKKQGYMMDKEVASWILEQEEGCLDRAARRLEVLKLHALEDKKISLMGAKTLLSQTAPQADFAWIDRLLFKKEPLELPECRDPSVALLFLGQLRYLVLQSLKIKALQDKGIPASEMLKSFPKMSPQALSHQIRKSDEYSLGFYIAVERVLFEKELELKKDFSEPKAIFMDIVTKIGELRFGYAR